jgi:cytosine deaminase
MCSGTALLYKIPRIIIGENINFMGDEQRLKAEGKELHVLQDDETIRMMSAFIKEFPHIWFEDIGIGEMACTVP